MACVWSFLKIMNNCIIYDGIVTSLNEASLTDWDNKIYACSNIGIYVLSFAGYIDDIEIGYEFINIVSCKRYTDPVPKIEDCIRYMSDDYTLYKFSTDSLAKSFICARLTSY